MAAEEAMRKADEAEAVRKWAEEELERVRNETEAPAASPEPWVTFEEMDRCPSSPPPPPPPSPTAARCRLEQSVWYV